MARSGEQPSQRRDFSSWMVISACLTVLCTVLAQLRNGLEPFRADQVFRASDVQTLAVTMKNSQALQREEPRHLHSCQRACFDASIV